MTQHTQQTIEAELTWTGSSFERGKRVQVDSNGVIESITSAGSGGAPTHRLARRALLPGMISSHSHAFQHAMRASAEIIPSAKLTGARNFWSWRETMYELVDSLDADKFLAITRHTFQQMRQAGMTTVGEFHYVRHAPGGQQDFAFDELVLQAACEAGIRLVFLSTLYQTSTIGKPVEGAQKRFSSPDVKAFWKQIDAIASKLDPRTQTIGVAPHSVRAVDIEDVKQVSKEAAKRDMVVHMHVEEQPREIDECVNATGRTPMRLLLEAGVVNNRFTAIHCTHSTKEDLHDFGAAGASICLCPMTEGLLSDGISNLPAMIEGGAKLCIGTDANARLSMNEELRWVEYVQRVNLQRRGICLDSSGDPATTLFNMATKNGASALGISAGAIAPGAAADFIALDLDHPTLVGWTDETLLGTFLFGCAHEPIAATCVAGDWRTHGE